MEAVGALRRVMGDHEARDADIINAESRIEKSLGFLKPPSLSSFLPITLILLETVSSYK